PRLRPAAHPAARGAIRPAVPRGETAVPGRSGAGGRRADGPCVPRAEALSGEGAERHQGGGGGLHPHAGPRHPPVRGGGGAGEGGGLLTDRTCFYAEQGGQVGDSGVIRTSTGEFEVDETQKLGDAVLHLGRVTGGTIDANQPATLEVGGDRPHTMRNHTATH